MEDSNKLRELAKEVGIIPIDTSKNHYPKIIMDVSCLPSEYKSLSIEEIVKLYKDNFGVSIIPIDLSKQNMQGNQARQHIIVL